MVSLLGLAATMAVAGTAVLVAGALLLSRPLDVGAGASLAMPGLGQA